MNAVSAKRSAATWNMSTATTHNGKTMRTIFGFLCLFSSFSNIMTDATITVMDVGDKSERYASRAEYYYGRPFAKGIDYWARLQYIEGNMNLCPTQTNRNTIYNITVPSDYLPGTNIKLPVALLVKNQGCPLEDKIQFLLEKVYPKNVVKYLIVDGDRSLRAPPSGSNGISEASPVSSRDFSSLQYHSHNNEDDIHDATGFLVDDDTDREYSSQYSEHHRRHLDVVDRNTDEDGMFMVVDDDTNHNDMELDDEYFYRIDSNNRGVISDEVNNYNSDIVTVSTNLLFSWIGEMGWMGGRKDATVITENSTTSRKLANNKERDLQQQPFMNVDLGILHVSYTTGYELSDILFEQSSTTKLMGGPRVVLNGKRGYKIGNRQLILWMAISALLSACACTFLIVVNNNVFWLTDDENENNGQNQQPQRERRRRLTREQIRTNLPIFEYDGSSLQLFYCHEDYKGNREPPANNNETCALVPSAGDAETSPLSAPLLPENLDLYTCSICLDEYEVGDKVRCLPCTGNHAYHARCIGRWLAERSASCPLCKDELFREDESTDEDSEFTNVDAASVGGRRRRETTTQTTNSRTRSNNRHWWQDLAFNPFQSSTSAAPATTGAAGAAATPGAATAATDRGQQRLDILTSDPFTGDRQQQLPITAAGNTLSPQAPSFWRRFNFFMTPQRRRVPGPAVVEVSSLSEPLLSNNNEQEHQQQQGQEHNLSNDPGRTPISATTSATSTPASTASTAEEQPVAATTSTERSQGTATVTATATEALAETSAVSSPAPERFEV